MSTTLELLHEVRATLAAAIERGRSDLARVDRLIRQCEEAGAPVPIVARAEWPFTAHRTMAQVTEDEKRGGAA